MYRKSDSEGMLIAKGITLVILIILLAWFYSADASDEGLVTGKWTEVSSPDSDGDTTTEYMIQMENGNIYGMFWGTRHWDQIQEGDYISFNARGRYLSLFGWRVATPDIFGFEHKTVETPRESSSLPQWWLLRPIAI